MDIRDIGTGTQLYLPVEVKGALFSVGDTHAAQGNGEVCGTAIESPVALAAKFELVKEAKLPFPRFTTPGPVSRHLDTKGYEVTTGIGPDLMEGARAAVSGMIDLLTRQHQISAIDAYLLCSVCADLTSARSSTSRTGLSPSTFPESYWSEVSETVARRKSSLFKNAARCRGFGRTSGNRLDIWATSCDADS